MSLETVASCPICEGNLFEYFLTCRDHTTTGEDFTIVKCKACDFTITSPRPDEKSIGNYYKSDSYISHTGSGKGLIARLYLIARNFTLASKTNLIRQYHRTGSLLDYGCGTGDFINHISQNGFDITGIEPSEGARQKANQINEGKVLKDITDVSGRKFDVITLWHVLEHVSDLHQTVASLKQALTPNGVIIIAVPNYKSHDAAHYKKYWAAYDVPRHLWHFSKDSMTGLLTKAGLKIVSIRPMNLDSFYVSLLSENYQNPKTNFLLRLWRGILHGLQSNLKARKNTNQSSLIYIATA